MQKPKKLLSIHLVLNAMVTLTQVATNTQDIRLGIDLNYNVSIRS